MVAAASASFLARLLVATYPMTRSINIRVRIKGEGSGQRLRGKRLPSVEVRLSLHKLSRPQHELVLHSSGVHVTIESLECRRRWVSSSEEVDLNMRRLVVLRATEAGMSPARASSMILF